MTICFLLLASAVGCARFSPAAAPAQPGEPVAVTVTTPDAGWSLSIERVLELDREVWILAQLRREPGMAAQKLSPLRVEIPVALPAGKPRRVFVAGKTWAWANEEPVEFVPSLAAVVQRAGAARALFPTAEPAAGPQPAR